MGFNIKMVDISNNNNISDLTTLKDNNVEYLYLKATEGKTFRDKVSPSRYSQAKELGLKVGFYHFLVGSSNPEDQAEKFYNYIKDYQSDLIPMLDVESDYQGMSNYTVRFINKFKELSGMEIGIYTYSGFLNNFTQEAIDVIKDLPCWIANYTNSYDRVNTGFFTNIVAWQYSENDSIGSFTGDCNVANEGCLLNGKGEWVQFEDKYWKYKKSDGSYIVRDWLQYKDNWYYFNEHGIMLSSCWLYLTENQQYYYFYSDGTMAHDCELWGTWKFDSNGHGTKIN